MIPQRLDLEPVIFLEVSAATPMEGILKVRAVADKESYKYLCPGNVGKGSMYFRAI